MNSIDKVSVDISISLGSATIPIHHLLRLGRGAVIELDTTENDPVHIFANDVLVATGEIKVEDGKVNVELTEKMHRQQ